MARDDDLGMTLESLLREFWGTVTQTTGCPKCGFVEVADKTTLSLSLDVVPYSALTARLKEFSSRVSIPKKICKGCGRCIDFETTNKMKRAPRILILHLNRFQERQNGKLRKILHDVCFEYELDLNGQTYSLSAIVIHYGQSTPKFSPYASLVKRDIGWLSFFNKTVKELYKLEVPSNREPIVGHVYGTGRRETITFSWAGMYILCYVSSDG